MIKPQVSVSKSEGDDSDIPSLCLTMSQICPVGHCILNFFADPNRIGVSVTVRDTLTHISIASFLWDVDEQCRPR